MLLLHNYNFVRTQLANFTQRALDAAGLDYESVRSKNPEIIYAVCSGFGPMGPLAGKKGFDGAAQARGGIVSITGPDETPVMIGASLQRTLVCCVH